MVFITGAGLKTVEAVVDQMNEPLRVPADASAFDEALAARGALATATAAPAEGA